MTGTPLDNTVFMREEDVRDAIEKKLTPYEVSPDEVSVAFVALRRGFDPDTVAKTIERENLDVKAITRGEIGSRLTRFFRVTLQIFLLTVVVGATLALLVVASVFSAVANERTREVGILRALGATRGHVIRLFLAEAVATGLIGGLVGIAAGAALSVPAVRAVDEVTRFPVFFSPLVLLAIGAGGLGAAVGVAVIGALQPVLRVSRIDPLDAIKDTGEAPSALPAPCRRPPRRARRACSCASATWRSTTPPPTVTSRRSRGSRSRSAAASSSRYSGTPAPARRRCSRSSAG